MPKKIIAVDIDDVLAANAAGFVAFSNARWGTNLTPDDYDEDWSKLWQLDHEQTNRRSLELHGSGAIGQYNHDDTALTVLRKLKQNYHLVVVTSRRAMIDRETRAWIGLHYDGIFDEIYFAGIYDRGLHDEAYASTKVSILKEIEADYLIDDQPKHCIAAAREGIETILFGEYPWNKNVNLTNRMTRCINWVAVEDYFNVQ